MLYNYIAIEGNIGSGKTTLASKLASDFNSRLILEQFTDNPFLEKFYSSQGENALALELFFMAERYSQLKNEQQNDLFHSNLFSDYFFIKSKLFAHNNLHADELFLFNRLFKIMNSSIKTPNLVVYLYADVKRLKKNISLRGRKYESEITDRYLKDIQLTYLDYLKKQKLFPVIILNVTNVDFVKNQQVYDIIKSIINKKYNEGIYFFNLTNFSNLS